jgi:type II secretory pathway pseudopilin PulG
MSTGVIVAIIVVAILVIGAFLLVLMPRMRASAEHRRRGRELRQAADARDQRAQQAEREARVAAAVADRERAEARLHHERVAAHDEGRDLAVSDTSETRGDDEHVAHDARREDFAAHESGREDV